MTTIGGIPAKTILDERDRLRKPKTPLEADKNLVPLIDRINAQLTRLVPESPQLKLRVTSTDSESLLRALVPHYETGGVSLPAGRHGTGLLSLQTFILLLEIGRERIKQRRSFILAMEEPELHVPPGLQRRLIIQAISTANQTICTSHTPRIAAFYPPTKVQILEKSAEGLTATPLLKKPLTADASNAARKFYYDDRARIIEALMHYRVLVPEGRNDYEWFRLLADVVETGDRAINKRQFQAIPIGAVVGIVPTHEAAVMGTFKRLRELRSGICAIVDGDSAGDGYICSLTQLKPPPKVIIQWPIDWTIESAICWILEAGDDTLIRKLRERIGSYDFDDLNGLRTIFDVKEGSGRLKTNYLAYEEIASLIGEQEGCLARAEVILKAVTLACLGRHGKSKNLEIDKERSIKGCAVVRFKS